jgi:hypothetical protein
VERKNDYALIISLDSVNSLVFVEAYTPILSLDSSTLSRIYLLTYDFPDTQSSTFCNTTHTPADSTTSASKRHPIPTSSYPPKRNTSPYDTHNCVVPMGFR